MSYNSGYPSLLGSPPYEYGNAATPMAFDIAALHEIYGANNNYNSGDNTYKLPFSSEVDFYWSCIWDTGGVDTISADGCAYDVVIDLTEASLLPEWEEVAGYHEWRMFTGVHDS